MAIPASGSQKDFGQLQTEFGGSNPIAMNEYGDKIGLTVGTTSAHNFDQFSGLSAAAFPGSGDPTWFNDGVGNSLPTSQQFSQNHTNASFAQVGCNSGYQNDQANDRIASRTTGYTSAAASVYTYAYVGYDGYATDTFQAKCDYSVSSSGSVGTVENPASYSPASGTWTNISTSNYSPVWQWSVTVNSGSGTRSLTSSSSPDFSVRVGTSGSGISGTARYLSLQATRGLVGGPGGGGGGGIECIHEDMLVSTQNGQESIHTVKDSASKIWAWNNQTSARELVDLLEIRIVNHDNLYTVNNLKLTEDHVVYLEGFVKASVAPAKTLENYEVTAAQLAVGDKLMKEDGTLETVTSIEVLAEEHVTYTLKTPLGNFYADGHLVDSEI
tara:strand:- start:67 stop:1218 length:1152 start_codon:yes stop_codon:yes gene_type:complete